MTDYRDPRPTPEDAFAAALSRMRWEREAIRAVNRDEDEAAEKAAKRVERGKAGAKVREPAGGTGE